MRKASRNRAKYVTVELSADPVLFYIAMSLLTILAIVEVNLHRNAGTILGMVLNGEFVDSRFVGP